MHFKKASKEYGVERHIGEDVIADIAEFVLVSRGKTVGEDTSAI